MLDKAIKSGKEKRKPYRDSRRFDRSCCNNRSCTYCSSNRQINKNSGPTIKEGLDEYYNQVYEYPV